MKKIFLILFLIPVHLAVYSQMNDGFEWPDINPENIQIVRDSFGVAHVFAKTDAEVAFGMAWATLEDEIELPMYFLGAGKNAMGRMEGIDGAAIDYAVQLMQIREIAEEEYRTMPDDFRKVLQGSCMGYNAWYLKNKDQLAEKYRKKEKYLFPVEPVDILSSYMLGLGLMAGIDGTLRHVVAGDYDTHKPSVADTGLGSNAWAFGPSRTVDGSTYLNNNSHQPLNGLLSWYEIHACSEEGWNIVGASFHGALSIFHGTNEYLGWGHTTGDLDSKDVFKLEMHPKKKKWYKVDGEWLKLETKRAKLKVRIQLKKKKKPKKKAMKKGTKPGNPDKGIVLAVGKKYWKSIYGPTAKSDNGNMYAIRMPALMKAKVAEQWWRMNKATNFDEFYEALNMQGVAHQNVTYADKEGNVFIIFNGMMPDRQVDINWDRLILGNTRDVLWESYIPESELAQFKNPPPGYVFNTNNSAFHATDPEYDLDPADFNPHIGYRPNKENNRSMRFDELMLDFKGKKLTWQDFLDLKFDVTYPENAVFLRKLDVTMIQEMKPEDYPDIADAIEKIVAWDRSADMDDTNFPIYLFAHYNIYHGSGGSKEKFYCENKEECLAFYADCIRKAKDHMLKHFGSIDVPLKEVQVLTRGEVEVPLDGGPDMLRAIYCNSSDEDGKLRPWVGDSYVELTRFPADGGLPEIWSVLPYGNSNMPDSPHYTDQMELYSQHKFKRMSLDKEVVFKQALRIYNPK